MTRIALFKSFVCSGEQCIAIEQNRIVATAATPFDAQIAALFPVQGAEALQEGSGEAPSDGVILAIT